MFSNLPISALLLVAGLSQAQGSGGRDADEMAPLVGPMVLAGSGPPAAATRSAFVDLAGGGAARIVVLAGDVARAKEIDWVAEGAGGVEVVVVKRASDVAAEAALGALLEADGVWLAGLPGKSIDAPLLRMLLVSAWKRGAVLGGAGADAAAFTGTAGAREPGRLGLVPRVELVFGAKNVAHDDAHQKAATQLPARVVVALPDGAALAVHCGRRIACVGEGKVGLAVKRKGNMLVREAVLDADKERDRGDPLGYQADLLSWVRTARSAEAPEFPPAKPAPPGIAKGALLVHGGGAVSEATWKRFLALAGGADASIVCIPSADAFENDFAPSSFSAKQLEKQGCTRVRILHAATRKRAHLDPSFAAAIDGAQGVWIDGGRTYRFMDRFEGTAAHAALRRVVERGGVVAGSSAGAQVIGTFLVRGDPKTNDELVDPGYLTALGLLPGVIIDAHFRDRNRTAEFGALVARHPQMLGFGVDADTAFIVQGQVGEVLGKGAVTMFDHRAGASVAEGVLLENGARYDLVRGKRLD
ncbi:MAG TPA: cyanophycinase [Planctomycetota bacterium]|nr:cyanophycinase [Planctomycetota bacterium]